MRQDNNEREGGSKQQGESEWKGFQVTDQKYAPRSNQVVVENTQPSSTLKSKPKATAKNSKRGAVINKQQDKRFKNTKSSYKKNNWDAYNPYDDMY